MVTKAVVPSTLVRAFQRFAVDDSESEAASDESGSSARHGLVLGVLNSCVGDENAVTIWGVVRDLADSDTVLPSVVGGVQAVGSFSVWIRGAASRDDDESAERDAAAQIAKQALAAVAVSSISVSISPQLALVYVHDSEHVHAFTSSTASNTIVPLPLDVVDCAHASDFLSATDSLLLRTSLTFQAETVQEITTWRKELESDDSTNVFFQFPEQRNNIFNVHGVRVDLTPVASTDDTLLRTLVKIPEKRQAAPTSKSKKKKIAVNDNWDVTSTMKSTPHDFLLGDNDSSSGYLKTLEYGEIADVHVLHSLGFSTSLMGSPALTLEVSRVRPTPVTVHADALVIVSQSSAVADVISHLRTELLKQLVRLEAQWTLTATLLRSHHFALVGAAFPVTLSAVNPTSSSTTTAMVSLATQFLQPTNQPLFTPASCSLVSNASTLGQMDVLFNVHEGIPSSGIPNGTQYLVDGFYGYYHYLQQSINDKGWGCAYRSLQTLASWLFWNHYTTTPTLSHLKIQETLVAMGDKPPAFLGSREWIGSMEVGFVLDELFGISFRTLNVASGVALVEKAQELKHHFETQGTPVMMGGGQLAFTLLGIDYNASSGECAFLILDPHYVGSEDLEIIQTKTIALEGYKAVPCGWRKAASFSKTSFYNLCLPQRPDTVEHE